MYFLNTGAPKLDTVNPQVRSTGGTHSAGLQDQVTAHALSTYYGSMHLINSGLL